MKEVKIVWVHRYDGEWVDVTSEYESDLAELLNEGWQIVTSGGGNGGFVILVRER